MDKKVFAEISDRLERGEPAELVVSAGGVEYIRRFEKNDRLILLGCGHVSLDVYRLARFLDFDVVAVDDRPMFANSGRFPEAEVICDVFASAIARLDICDKDYVCVLTRGHRWDRECVEAILSGTMPKYLGMISSSRRAEGMKELLLENGFDRERVDAVHAPIGLDIGAMTTAEIALSICAEMIAFKRREQLKPRPGELAQTDFCLDTLRYLANSTEPRAMLIVLDTDGSTPVKSGSMMAVNSLGEGRGTIGGGCGEAAAMNAARGVIGTGGRRIMTFDMSGEVAADNDMVCGGEMTVCIVDIEN